MNKYTFFYITGRGEEKQEIVEATCFGRAYWTVNCSGCMDCMYEEIEDDGTGEYNPDNIKEEYWNDWAIRQISTNYSLYKDGEKETVNRCYLHGMTVYDFDDEKSMDDFFNKYGK